MATWDDLTDPDDFVVEELSRPRRATDDGEAAAAAPAADTASGPTDSNDADEDEEGFSDPSGSVTVWVDDEFSVVRVRISTRWRDNPQPLGQRVVFAAQAATMQTLFATQPQDTGWWSEMGDAPKYAPESPVDVIDDREYEFLKEETRRLDDEVEALLARDDVRPTVVHFDEARGVSQNQKATVVLDQNRRATAVEFDERWVAGARTESIIDAVRQAFTSAYDSWQEPRIEPGELAELNARLAEHQRRLMEPVLRVGGWLPPRG